MIKSMTTLIAFRILLNAETSFTISHLYLWVILQIELLVYLVVKTKISRKSLS